jgi:hypothetical protein
VTPNQFDIIRDAVKASALVTRCVCRTPLSCNPRTPASEPLKPGEGRVAKAGAEVCSGGYTLGFHHLERIVSTVVRAGGKWAVLLELNWKDEEEKKVWRLREF